MFKVWVHISTAREIRLLLGDQISAYLTFASTAVLVYDYLLTFSDEVHLVWMAPWGLGKVLFFLTRYPAFADVTLSLYYHLVSSLSPAQCQSVYQSIGWMFIVGIIISEVIMLLRVWAIWRKTRMATIFLSSICVASIIGGIIGFQSYNSSRDYLLDANPQPCHPIGGNKLVFVDFIILMIFETLILIMTLIKCIQHFRQDPSSLLTICLRDGIIYFVSQLAISFVNVVVIVASPNELDNLLTPLQRSLHSILSARILLTLRKATLNTNPLFPGGSQQRTLRTMAFARPINTSWFGTEEADGPHHLANV